MGSVYGRRVPQGGWAAWRERNFRPHVNCVVPTPENKFICAVDNGIDQVKIYRITPHNKLSLVDILRCARESGAQAAALQQGRTFCLPAVRAFQHGGRVLPTAAARHRYLKNSRRVSTTSGQCGPEARRCFRHVLSHRTETICLPPLREDNTVAMFRIDRETGMLTKEFALPISGEYPKDIAMFPDGKHIAVVNHESQLYYNLHRGL